MPKHSPGPWAALISDRGVLIDSAPAMIAKVPFSGEQAEADGRLIAAAPDLLAALEVVVADWTAQFERNGHKAPAWCKQARAAIAKATGETP